MQVCAIVFQSKSLQFEEYESSHGMLVSSSALEWPVKICVAPLVFILFWYFDTVYFRLDIPQTTSSLRTPVDINSLTDTFWQWWGEEQITGIWERSVFRK